VVWAFSILVRIELTATTHPPTRRRPPSPLSVSSFGSSSLQPFAFQSHTHPKLTFQYPRSDRAHCNKVYMRPHPSQAVFQYPRSDRAHCNRVLIPDLGTPRVTFSILVRIELTATCPDSTRSYSPPAFSILVRIELTATTGTDQRPSSNSPFQYPRSDRAHCN